MRPLGRGSVSFNAAIQRSFATIQDELIHGRAAFLLGAGIDILIAEEFRKNKGHLPPSWMNLVSALPPFPTMISESKQTKARVLNLIQSWPTETASLARWWNGDREFQARISGGLDDRNIISEIKKGIPEATSTHSLCRLLIKSNLIITPNYSSYLVHALRAYKPDLNIAVIDREDLPSLPFPPSEKNPRTIFVIHLHGRCSARSFPVLDAWGYNILQHDDNNYIDLLRRMFTDRSVLTFGISWSDQPLRSAAAFVQRTRPYLSKRHLVLYFVPSDEKRLFGDVSSRHEPQGMARLWSNTMRSAYGVDILFVDETTQPRILQKLESDKDAQNWSNALAYKQKLYEAENDWQRLTEVWQQIADLLDSCGDYESPLQHRFLRAFSGVDAPTSVAVADATHELAEKLLGFVKGLLSLENKKRIGVNEWGIAARIERHLRHHLYLYRPRDESNIRQMLWQVLWRRLPLSEWKAIPDQLKFDFLIGKFELKFANVNLAKFRNDIGSFEDRFSKASRIWSHAPGSHPPKDKVRQKQMLNGLQKLAVELLDLGWESLAAKVMCDHMHLLAVIASASKATVDDPLAKLTAEQATHAGRISRSAGCFRRQVKADSIAAMWTSDPLEGRVQLLGNIRAAEETRSVEPGLLGGLGAALLTCDFRARMRSGQPIKNLRTLVTDLFDEAGLDRLYIYDALKYWIPFTPAPVKTSMSKLAKEMGVKFVQR